MYYLQSTAGETESNTTEYKRDTVCLLKRISFSSPLPTWAERSSTHFLSSSLGEINLALEGFRAQSQELTKSKHLLGNSGQVMASLRGSVFLPMKTKIIPTSSSYYMELKKTIHIKYLAQSLECRQCAQ